MSMYQCECFGRVARRPHRIREVEASRKVHEQVGDEARTIFHPKEISHAGLNYQDGKPRKIIVGNGAFIDG